MKTNCPEPGVYLDIPFSEYCKWEAVNQSILKALQHTPALAKERLDNPEGDEDKEAYVLGRLFHLMTCQPKLVDKEFKVRPNDYHHPKDPDDVVRKWSGNALVCKEQIRSWEGRGLTVIDCKTHVHASRMAESVLSRQKAGTLLSGASVEVSVVWDDPTTGIRCKGRWDTYKGGVIGDLKSTRSAKADSFFADAYKRGYHIQSAMYIDAQKVLDAQDRVPWFVFVVCENYPPYCAREFDVHDDIDAGSFPFIDLGRKTYKTLLQQFKYCQEHDKWPGYPDEHCDALLPPWVKDAEAFEMH